MEQVDGRPKQVVKVGFEARVAQGRDQGVEDVGNAARDGIALGIGPWGEARTVYSGDMFRSRLIEGERRDRLCCADARLQIGGQSRCGMRMLRALDGADAGVGPFRGDDAG